MKTFFRAVLVVVILGTLLFLIVAFKLPVEGSDLTVPSRSDDPTLLTWLIRVGLSLCVVGGCIYVWLYAKHKEVLSGMGALQKVSHLVSHLPDDDEGPHLHVVAGVLSSIGLCAILGAIMGFGSIKLGNFTSHGTALTAAGLVFGFIISTISFWTLWQTKRIERLQGSYIEGFQQMTRGITRALKKVNDDFNIRPSEPCDFHRFYLITTNPHFGLLSFRYHDDQEQFYHELMRAAENVARSNKKFKLGILCASESMMKKFHQDFYHAQEGSGRAVAQEDVKVTRATEDTEEFIRDLEAKAKTAVISRKDEIPLLQFAVVGFVVFEFFLTKPGKGSGTGISGARRVEERTVSDRFLTLFESIVPPSGAHIVEPALHNAGSHTNSSEEAESPAA